MRLSKFKSLDIHNKILTFFKPKKDVSMENKNYKLPYDDSYFKKYDRNLKMGLGGISATLVSFYLSGPGFTLGDSLKQTILDNFGLYMESVVNNNPTLFFINLTALMIGFCLVISTLENIKFSNMVNTYVKDQIKEREK